MLVEKIRTRHINRQQHEQSCKFAQNSENDRTPIGGEREHRRRCEARLRDVGLGILAFVVCFTQDRSPCCFFALGQRLMLVRTRIGVWVTFYHNNRLKIAYTSSWCQLKYSFGYRYGRNIAGATPFLAKPVLCGARRVGARRQLLM